MTKKVKDKKEIQDLIHPRIRESEKKKGFLMECHSITTFLLILYRPIYLYS